MNEGQNISDDLPSSEEDEELLVYVDFDTVLEDSIFQNNTLLKIIALESEEPFLQIGTQMYSGKWVDTVGTYLFFEPELASAPVDPVFSDISHKQLNYKFKTRKCLDISRVFVNQKSNEENAEHLHSIKHNGTQEDSKKIQNKECDSSVQNLVELHGDLMASEEHQALITNSTNHNLENLHL